MHKFILIAGGGKFGLRALEFASENGLNSVTFDIDHHCEVAKDERTTIIEKEDIMHIIRNSSKEAHYFLNTDLNIILSLLELNPQYIIPVLPIHLVAELIKIILSQKSIKLEPDTSRMELFLDNAKEELILGNDKEQGISYLSYAQPGEICPDNCTGPPDFCPNFNREKPVTMTRYVKDFFFILDTIKLTMEGPNFVDLVIESKQLKSGLGGILGAELSFVLDKIGEKIAQFQGQETHFMISTTCNCHGVISFYQTALLN